MDTAGSFLNQIHDRMGFTGSSRKWTQISYTLDALTACNAAIRSVAVDLGVVGHDTITVVQDTKFYSLVSTYMDKELPHLPLQVFRESANGVDLVRLLPGGPSEFGSSPKTGGARFYTLAGDRLWIYPAGEDADKIYIEGPLEGTTFTNGASTTNISEEDKIAVVYRAVALLARGKERHRLADYYEDLYTRHIQLVQRPEVIAAP